MKSDHKVVKGPVNILQTRNFKSNGIIYEKDDKADIFANDDEAISFGKIGDRTGENIERNNETIHDQDMSKNMLLAP